MKIGDIIYSIEYDIVGKLLKINYKEAIIEDIDSKGSRTYANIDKCRIATQDEIEGVFEVK